MATVRTAARVELTTKTETKLSATVNTKVMADLTEFAQIDAEIAVLEEAKDKVKARIREAREKTGSASWEFEGGWKTTDVTGQTTKVDLDQMVADGVITQAERERYTTITPKKAYEKITVPKEFKPVLAARDKKASKPRVEKQAKLLKQGAR